MIENPVRSPKVPPIAEIMSTNLAALSLVTMSNVVASKQIRTYFQSIFLLSTPNQIIESEISKNYQKRFLEERQYLSSVSIYSSVYRALKLFHNSLRKKENRSSRRGHICPLSILYIWHKLFINIRTQAPLPQKYYRRQPNGSNYSKEYCGLRQERKESQCPLVWAQFV